MVVCAAWTGQDEIVALHCNTLGKVCCSYSAVYSPNTHTHASTLGTLIELHLCELVCDFVAVCMISTSCEEGNALRHKFVSVYVNLCRLKTRLHKTQRIHNQLGYDMLLAILHQAKTND